jgi:glucose-1-phosphate thymidylyltransferase
MRAIIPVAGQGTKLRPHTYSQPKALIPLAGKTVLGIIVDQLIEAGIHEFVFVVGYLGDKIEDYIKQNYPKISSNFVYQNHREGTAHAIKLTKELVLNEEVFIVLGDTICEFDIKAMLESPYSVLGVKRVDNPSKFGVVETDEKDKYLIKRLEEKPTLPTSNIALVGLYKIKETQQLFDCLETMSQQGAGANGNFNLTEALQCMINTGIVMRTFKVDNWFDCGQKESVLATNAVLLKKYGTQIHELPKFENTILIPPVTIGKDCNIKNAIIGPNVTIGNNTTINMSIVNNSIIGSYAKLQDVVLENSLTGNDVLIKGLRRSLNLGDNTEIDFG